MDALGVGALGLVTVEWLALGWLSGLDWPAEAEAFWAPRWALRLLVGAVVVALAQLLLALSGLGFGSLPLGLSAAAVVSAALRLVSRPFTGGRLSAKGNPSSASAPPAGRASAASAGAPAAARASAAWAAAEGARSAPAASASGSSAGAAPAAATARPVWQPDRREQLGWLLLAIVLLAATSRSLLVPEAGWDAYSHWGLRAQAFALAGTIVNAGSEHEYYPPLVPFLEAWLFLHRGAVSIDLAKTLWAVLGSAFSVCLAWHLRLSLRQVWLAPWLATAIVLITPSFVEGFSTGQGDLALTAYLTLTALALVHWSRARRPEWLILAGVFAAAATLSKLEGAPRVAVLVAALALEAFLARRPDLLRPAALLLGVAAACVGLWTLGAARAGSGSNSEHLGAFQPLALGSILITLAAVFGGIRTGGGLFVAALTWLLSGRQLLCQPLRLLTLMVVGELTATVLAFLLSDTAPAIEVRTSATRLFEHWLPLALYAGIVACEERGVFEWRGSYNRPGR